MTSVCVGFLPRFLIPFVIDFNNYVRRWFQRSLVRFALDLAEVADYEVKSFEGLLAVGTD